MYKSRDLSIYSWPWGWRWQKVKCNFHGNLICWAKRLAVSITHPTLNNLGLIFLRCWFNTSLYYYPGSSSALTLCLQLCSMLALFISSRYKQRSDIWAFSDAPSISSLNMCLPDQYGGWRLRWSMLQISCTGIMYKTGRDVEGGEKFFSAFVSHQILYAIVLRNGLCVERAHHFWTWTAKWWALWDSIFEKKKSVTGWCDFGQFPFPQQTSASNNY